MPKITKLEASEILDSRGNPTISVICSIAGGFEGTGIVPSGASTGKNEACELRDNDPSRMNGKGVLKAVFNVNNEIGPKIQELDLDQKSLDAKLIELDGTTNKSRLGANAILAVSLAFARASAKSKGVELYSHIADLYFTNTEKRTYLMPQPAFNVINGGKHSQSGIPFQEFMLIPQGVLDIRTKVAMADKIISSLKNLLVADGQETTLGDEGGFAPKIVSNEKALQYLEKAISGSGYNTKQIKIGLDAAASSFYDGGMYNMGEQSLSQGEMLNIYKQLCALHPIVSIEDAFHEEDFEGFTKLNKELGEQINIVGDDLTVTNTDLIKKAIKNKSINTLLVKPNQIGTLSETLEAIRIAKENSIKIFISHRSGETLDTFIADLSVAVSADFIKAGAPTRPERIAKYNRLIEIENSI